MAERSQVLGLPSQLDHGSLPTKLSVFNHMLKIRKEKERAGIWKHNTPLSEVVKKVSSDLKTQWEKTDIPTYFQIDQVKAHRKVLEVLQYAKQLTKIPVHRRGENFGSDLNSLLDVSICLHDDSKNCSCPPSHKVYIL